MGKLDHATFLEGNARERLRDLEPESVQTAVTSPPYWGLRDYDAEGQLGLEPTPEEYVENLVDVFREVKRVLRPDGTFWLNLGDSYYNYRPGGDSMPQQTVASNDQDLPDSCPRRGTKIEGLKEKDQVGIPWRVAFALQEDGWYLRSDIVWCLSGGTSVYVRTQKGIHTTTVNDLSRLGPSTIELWNGEKWTQVRGISETDRPDNPITIQLRSGETIGCTPDHKWPLENGEVVKSKNLSEGDVISSTTLAEPNAPKTPEYLPDDMGWIIGYYLAEGSKFGRGRIQFSCHSDEKFDQLEKIVEGLGGNVSRKKSTENGDQIRVYGGLSENLIDMYVGGRKAKTKCLKNKCWKRSDEFLGHILDGYLAGDGSYDEKNNRWRLCFTRNNKLATDLRTICARLGYTITLNKRETEGFGKKHKIYRGEIKKERTGHFNEKPKTEIVDIRGSRARKFYDIGVEDEPHTFALASGVLTHNSKPAPMPESVKDRPTSSHEFVFLLTKNKDYFYDHEAIKEPATSSRKSNTFTRGAQDYVEASAGPEGNAQPSNRGGYGYSGEGKKNKRDVWTVSTKPSSFAHFAVFPLDLVEPCVKAGTSAFGQCISCGSPYERVLEEEKVKRNREEKFTESKFQHAQGRRGCSSDHLGTSSKTVGWEKGCDCPTDDVERQTVLDPFSGASTTGIAALKHGRRFVGVEINPEYIELSKDRIRNHEDVPTNHNFW